MPRAIPISGLSWTDRILAPFSSVRRGEGASTLLLALNVFLLLTMYYVLKVVREPLILLGGGGAELKAYASAGQTLLLLAVIPLFSKLANHVDRRRLMTIMQLIFIGCLIAFYLLAQAEAPIGLAFYLWLGIFSALVISNFWSFANDLYNQEQGKRLFPIVAVGGSIGAIVGAQIPERLASVLGTYQLMLLAAGGLAVSIVIYRIVDAMARRADWAAKSDDAKEARAAKAAKAAEAAEPEPPKAKGAMKDKRGGFRLVLRDKYLLCIGLLVLVATIENTCGEYVVSKLAEDAGKLASDPEGYIRGFYSSYYSIVNIASALLQAFVVSRLIKWIGIRGSLFVLPIVVVGGWIAFLAYATINTIRVTKTAENSLDYSLQNTIRQALFLPTSRDAKYKAKAAIDTFFFRVGDVIAGLGVVVVLVEVFQLGVRAFAVVNLVLAAIWCLLAWKTGKLHDQRSAEHAEKGGKGGGKTDLVRSAG